MNILVKFHVTSDKIIIEIPGKNLYLEKPNIVFYDSQTKSILGVGGKDTIHHEKGFPEQFNSGASFQFDDEISGFFDSVVVEYYLGVFYYSKQTFIDNFLAETTGVIDYEFQIASYDKWSEQRRLKFEYELQSRLHARQLKINETNREVSVWKRRIEKISRFALTGVYLPAVIIYFLFKTQISTIYFLIEKYSVIGLFIVFSFVGILIVVCNIAWVFITKRVLPKSYNSYIFEDLKSGSLIQKITKAMLSFQGQV